MALSFGTPFTWETGALTIAPKITRLTSTKAVVGYGISSQSCKVVVVNTDGSVGAPVDVGTFEDFYRIVALTSDKVFILTIGASGNLVGFIGNISGNAISIDGGPTTLTSVGNVINDRADVCVLDSGRVLLVYNTTNDSNARARIISISGNTMTPEAVNTYDTGAPHIGLSVAKIDDSTAIMVCEDGPDLIGRILHISGNTVSSVGSRQVITAGNSDYAAWVDVLSPSLSILVYVDAGSISITARTLSRSGDTITPNSTTMVENASSARNYLEVHANGSDSALCVYEYSNDLKVAILSISGASVTVGDTAVINTTINEGVTAAVMNPEALVAYNDGDDGAKGKSALTTGLPGQASHLWLSTDGAQTFTNIGDPAWGTSVVGAVAIKPGTNYQTLWAMVGTKLYKTTDGGGLWAQVADVGYEADAMDLLQGSGDVLFVANRAGGGNRASLVDDATGVVTHINTGKSTSGGATAGKGVA